MGGLYRMRSARSTRSYPKQRGRKSTNTDWAHITWGRRAAWSPLCWWPCYWRGVSSQPTFRSYWFLSFKKIIYFLWAISEYNILPKSFHQTRGFFKRPVCKTWVTNTATSTRVKVKKKVLTEGGLPPYPQTRGFAFGPIWHLLYKFLNAPLS